MFNNPIFMRRSIRRFQDKPVDDRTLKVLMEAAMAAPSAVNARPWEFYITRDHDLMEKLAAASPYATPAKKAPVLIAACYRTDTIAPEYGQIDMAISCENLMLEAEALGLGTVLLGIAPEEERMASIKRTLNLPENQECFGLIPVGYPDEQPKARETYDQDKVHLL